MSVMVAIKKKSGEEQRRRVPPGKRGNRDIVVVLIEGAHGRRNLEQGVSLCYSQCYCPHTFLVTAKLQSP